MSERINKETVLATSYQRFNNGGIHMSLIRHDSIPEDEGEDRYTTLWLETQLRNMGSAAVSRIQVFATTLKVLAHFSDEIAKLVDVIDPNYLRTIDADITLSDGTELRYRGPSEDGSRTGVTLVGSIDPADDMDDSDTDAVDPDFDPDHPNYTADNAMFEPAYRRINRMALFKRAPGEEGEPQFTLGLSVDGEPERFDLTLQDVINLEGLASSARLNYESNDTK